MPKLLLLFVLVISTTIDARRSRIDLPITNAADAPAGDNVATASGDDIQVVKVPAPSAPPPDAASDMLEVTSDGSLTTLAEMVDSMGAVAEIEEECDPDMIGFEIVTG